MKILIFVFLLICSVQPAFSAETYIQNSQNKTLKCGKQLQKQYKGQQTAFQSEFRKIQKKHHHFFNKLKKNINQPPDNEPETEKNGLLSFLLGFSTISDGIIILILFFNTSIFIEPLFALSLFFILMFSSSIVGIVTANISLYRHKKYRDKYKDKNAATVGLVTAILKLLISVPALFLLILSTIA